AVTIFRDPDPIKLNASLVRDLRAAGVQNFSSLMPTDIFSWNALFTIKGLLFTVAGGFMVGFGTRYAGGCTSGHSIMGLSALQWPSLIATIFFMIGGFIMSNLIVPFMLKL
ncbi:MAG TPA: YeeE/YedE thiosulfate transporter family protein, partial [Puia sp.]|nr:YeeE/YedE thiosulfate transporter family protein [Puia sp.]